MPHSRRVRGWTPKKASDYPVAPHRYFFNREAPEDAIAEKGSSTIRAYKEALPYKAGDTIMVAKGDKAVKAMILDILVDYDRYGDRRPVYQCAVETRTGFFSQVWTRHYAGNVQRGYHLAGMAPDLDGII